MIDFLKPIPIFFHVPKNAGTFVRWNNKIILYNECKYKSCLRTIIIKNENKEQILELQVLDQKKITKNKIFLRDKNSELESLEVSLEDFVFLEEKKDLEVFSASILDSGFLMHDFLINLIEATWSRKSLSYMILRDPLENEWSFYNYITTRLCQKEETAYQIKSNSFKEYITSDEMSDSWLIRNLTKVDGDIKEEHFDKVIEILNNINIFNIKQSSSAVKTMIKDCYGISVDIKHNTIINKNKSKSPMIKKEDIGMEILRKFEQKKQYEYKIFNKYGLNLQFSRFFQNKEENIKKEDCFFCHDMTFNEEKVNGTWDLSKCIDSYLGRVNLKNKRVIDVGAGSGYPSFYMEKMGAEVVSHELPNGNFWDLLKHPNSKGVNPKLNEPIINAYWYAHEKYKSKNDLFLWDIYKDLPEEIGSFDVAVFSMVLSHFRDPFLALMNVLYRTKEKAILINTFTEQPTTTGFFYGEDGLWWELSKQCIHCFMEKVGFRLISEEIVLPYNNEEKQEKLYKCLVFERF